MMKTTTKRSLIALGVLGALAATSANASMRISDAIDGNWAEAGRDRRGIDFDFIPTGQGQGTLFMTLFTYDEEGNGIWLTGNANDIGEFDYKASFAVGRVSGGDFGSGGTPTPEVLGTADVEFFSCNRAVVTLTMNADSGLPSTEYELEPSQIAFGDGRQECVWDEEFTACPAGTTATSAERTCLLDGNIFGQNVTLTNNAFYEIGALVLIGDDNANSSTLTIEPGTVIKGLASEDAIYVNRGSKIFAEGTAQAPIIFTSLNDKGLEGGSGSPATGDWGGLIISGNGPVNCPGGECESEFSGLYGRALPYGGDNADDSSGALSHVQVRYGGVEFVTDSETNSFTMQGVGRGTKLEYLQAYRGQDDGIEFFGGNANLKYFVSVDGGDDDIDWDVGYSGKIQFALVEQGSGFGENHGIEGASNPDNADLEPRATPIVSNFTFLGNATSPNNNDAFQFKDGSAGQLWNSYAQNFTRSCLRIQGDASVAQAGEDLVIRNTRLNCATPFSSDTAFDVAAFFNGLEGNSLGDGGLVNGFLPGTGSALRGAAAVVPDDFFIPTDYIGAFGNVDWTKGWTYGVRRN